MVITYNDGDPYEYVTSYTLGPATIVSNALPLSPVTTPSISNSQPAAPTATGTGTLNRLSCEFIVATLLSMALWLLA
jgi:hypothetical protein